MSITNVDKDYDNLTITVIAEFDAPIDQVWEMVGSAQARALVGSAGLSGDIREARSLAGR